MYTRHCWEYEEILNELFEDYKDPEELKQYVASETGLNLPELTGEKIRIVDSMNPHQLSDICKEWLTKQGESLARFTLYWKPNSCGIGIETCAYRIL